MAETSYISVTPSAPAGCQSSHFDNHETLGVSKTAVAANVVRLRPTTILTTRERSKQAKADDKRAYLTEAEVARLIKAAETPRDKAMILIGYRHGLRVSELVNLRWRQIDLDAGRIQVERLKDSESGVHPLSGREIRTLRAVRRAQPVGSAFVFLSYKGAPMTRQAFDKLLRGAGAKKSRDAGRSRAFAASWVRFSARQSRARYAVAGGLSGAQASAEHQALRQDECDAV